MKLPELPYISHIPLDGRAVLLQPWFDGRDWHSYMEAPPGEFVRALPGRMESGVYYAAAPASPTDLHFPFGTLIAQHLSFQGVAGQFYALVEDIHMLTASLEKLELMRLSVREKHGASFLVATELEYLFVLVRAMYDVLQNVVRQIARLLCTPGGRTVVQELPGSFADMVLKGEPQVRRSARELSEKYGLPRHLADCYANEAEFFQRIRDIRVGIEHHGRSLPSIYATDRGFAVGTRTGGPWSSLDIWQRHELMPNDLGSVRALAAYLGQRFLGTLNAFEQALRQTIHPTLLPAPISLGNEIFVTNAYISRLANLDAVIASPWSMSASEEDS